MNKVIQQDPETKKLYIIGFYDNINKGLHDVPYIYSFDVTSETDDYYVILRKRKKVKVSKKDLRKISKSCANTQYYLEIPEEHIQYTKDFNVYMKMKEKLKR